MSLAVTAKDNPRADSRTTELIAACNNDYWPESVKCLTTFMFDKCRSEEECPYMLGLWQGIVNHMDEFNVDALNTVVVSGDNNELILYVKRMYAGKKSLYFEWFEGLVEGRVVVI